MTALVGIDLGTTNSALAILDQTGRPEIVPNAEGDHVTPSVVFFELDGSATSVGQAAKDNAIVYPDRVFHEFKRSMATNAPITVDGRQVTPVELSSLVLRKLVEDTSERKGEIRGAVITVPANFTNEARVATIKAGELAGLRVTHIINEPTAALFYYSYHKPVSGTVVVYDFGGGTLDVSIARVSGKNVEIVTSKGDPRLGGIDFDRKLSEVIRRTFEASTGEKFDERTHQLGKTPEEYKKQLTTRNECAVQIVGGKTGRKILTITRQEFETATATLISKADLLVDSTLDEAGLRPADITHVFLVGGSTRMPMVATHLEKLFGKPPVCHVNPDEVVALGAALYAGFSAEEKDLNPAQKSVVSSMQLQEVANHFFGTICQTSDVTGRQRLRNSIIIEKNTPLPCSKTEPYYTVRPGQQAVDVSVTQSATREDDPDFVRTIWEGSLGPLPEGRPANMEIRVTYSYDTNQIMHCRFEDVASGLTKEIDIGVKSALTDTSLEGVDRILIDDE
jgi:molecular chaperone DnaK